ncbi:hypothetical protein H0H93_015903 [Arthromyces matolae]|nr:hypothetical protein H0H93_015903 [Arthromyces matolae]
MDDTVATSVTYPTPNQASPYREDDDTPHLPLSDSIEWYYPSQGYESDEDLLDSASIGGNWGNKTIRGARWVRKGKITTWGPTMEDWESEERARKRIKLMLSQERRSPSPPSLPHLERSPSPPLLAPYPPPDLQHLSYASFVMDKAVTHSFRSNLLDELEHATNTLIEGETMMNRAMGRLWQVINEETDKIAKDTSLIPKQEEENGVINEDDTEERIPHAPDLTPPMHKLFLPSLSDPPDPSHFSVPEMQLDILEKSLATLRELQDDGREYAERLQEIRDGLGDIRAQRDGIWDLVRERAVKELHDVAYNATNVSIMNINDGPPVQAVNPDDRYMRKLETYARSLPYAIEPYHKMLELLDFIILRIVQCVEAKDFDVGLHQWDSMLTYWCMLKYPIPKDRRVRLAQLYFLVSTIPGMPINVVAICADAFCNLTKSEKKVSIKDMRLPWKPIYEILKSDLFLKRRQFEYTQLSWCMGYIASHARRFFSPAAIEEMLETFVPQLDGTQLDKLLAPQYYLLTFLPLSHPQTYLPMLFRIWESVNSYMYDERMLHFLSKLSEMHVDPSISDPNKIAELSDDERVEGEGRPRWSPDKTKTSADWSGLFKDVGIFTEYEWQFLMCKCLASMGASEIPLADAGSLTTGPNADKQASFEIGRLPKPDWRIASLARVIVYSMMPDGEPVPPSNAPTPLFSPLPSGMNTPMMQSATLTDFLASPLGKKDKSRTYLAGSKALDSLARLIASVESFFHPSNSGAWTNDHCRLTKTMKRELVKSLRTVTLLAMFSQDSTTVANIQSCLKSMSVMEPDLILHPILERAVPSLEALVETQRTIAVIKALGAVTPAIVSRQVYYPGAKHLVPILQLLIPGIDLLCTAAFLVEIAQFVKFGDLTNSEGSRPAFLDSEPTLPLENSVTLPSFSLDDLDSQYTDVEQRLSNEEEDALLQDSTGNFPDWVASFIRRVIQLFENLPDEGPDGSAGVQLVDAVTGACSQICVHLSEPLYDLVLNMIYDYATTNVRPNAVRAIHQLVECVANADPAKTLAKFIPFCTRKIKGELETGASSLRTTSVSSPLPSDATLHWNLAILRGAIYNDGRSLLKHKDELIALFKILHDKTHSKRGYSWSGKLLSSTLLTLTHTYPLENKFNAHTDSIVRLSNRPPSTMGKTLQTGRNRGKANLFEFQLSWHSPNEDEIQFAIDLFKTLVEPAIDILEGLIEDDTRDEIWRNDFCRHLSLVRNAFSGIPTLVQQEISPEDSREAVASSDILNEVSEMIATITPIASGFCLTDSEDPRHRYISTLRDRFGVFLHKASVSLQQQGEENTVDAVDMLVGPVPYSRLQHRLTTQLQIRAVRTYLLDYGDNSTTLPDFIGTLLSADVVYDGVRRRALPILFEALEPGTDDDRMKGALWMLNSPFFGKYAISEPSLSPSLIKGLLGCQHNEKPSIQDCVAAVAENGLNSFLEPNYLVYDVPTPRIDKAIVRLRNTLDLGHDLDELDLVARVRTQRLERTKLLEAATQTNITTTIEVGESEWTHWRYEIVATRALRTLVRRDAPTSPRHLEYFLNRVCDDHPSILTFMQYAQRAVTKIARNIKLRTFCTTPADLALMRVRNPLKMKMVIQPSDKLSAKFLADFKIPFNPREDNRTPLFCDQDPPGWVVWEDSITLYLPPAPEKSAFSAWDPSSQDTIKILRETVMKVDFWDDLSEHYAEENHETTLTQDNASFVKSICKQTRHFWLPYVINAQMTVQILEEDPFDILRPIMETLLENKDQNKQRAAAEFVAGVISGKETLLSRKSAISHGNKGSKHWPTVKQEKLWKWFKPFLKQVLANIKTDTLMIWTSFFEYIFYHTDPRRVQPLVEFVVAEFKHIDYNAEMTFDGVKVLSVFRAFYEELGRKFDAWTQDTLLRTWTEISSEHDDLRAYIGEILAFTEKIKWSPKPSSPTTEVFVKECRIAPRDFDIMGIRGMFHRDRILELVKRFQTWREERLPSAISPSSTSKAKLTMVVRVGILVCKWFYRTLHDVHAVSAFDYILPLMPELFRFTELHDNTELANRAGTLLVRMCGVTPLQAMVAPILDGIFEAIQTSASWRIRLKAIPLVQVFYFRSVPIIPEIKIVQILEVLCSCLDDEVVEVREMAATTLSGILRLSPRRSVLTLKERFSRLAKNSHIPVRTDPDYNKAIRKRHAAILGICALVDSYPYTVEKWMPELLTDVLAEHTYDPIPISTTIPGTKTRSDSMKTNLQHYQPY